jgi:hypothetical protein
MAARPRAAAALQDLAQSDHSIGRTALDDLSILRQQTELRQLQVTKGRLVLPPRPRR